MVKAFLFLYMALEEINYVYRIVKTVELRDKFRPRMRVIFMQHLSNA